MSKRKIAGEKERLTNKYKDSSPHLILSTMICGQDDEDELTNNKLHKILGVRMDGHE